MKKELEMHYFPILENDLNMLLKEKMKLAKKADILNLLNVITPKAKTFRDLQTEFFKKNGEERNGQYFLPPNLAPDIEQEYKELAEKKESFSFSGLKWADVQNISSEYPYVALLEMLKP